ncbi:MAG: DNA-processing protein DprA [Faecousia sp.]
MLEHWLWLAHLPGLNEHTKVLLLQTFQSPEAVYGADDHDLAGIPGLTPSGRQALADKSLERYVAALGQCSRDGIRILTYLDEEYPRRLKNIYNPPLVLYYKGTLPKFDGFPTIGVVGTRRCSAYGLSVAGRLGAEISSCGGLVVSGLAEGIDAAAMKGALKSGFPTVGVLGTGADIVYPLVNKSLFSQVERHGCILSEFLPGTPGFKQNFPKRNRIISGLSVAVVIVESPEKSGALHTARSALEQGRDVYAVPGNVDLASFAGSNRLLREGACPVCCGWDVMGEYTSLFPGKIRKAECAVPEQQTVSEPVQSGQGSLPPKRGQRSAVRKKDIDNGPRGPYSDVNTALQGLSGEERAIVSCLTGGEKLVDDVIAATGIPSGLVLRSLTMLELKGIVARLPGNRIGLRK